MSAPDASPASDAADQSIAALAALAALLIPGDDLAGLSRSGLYALLQLILAPLQE